MGLKVDVNGFGRIDLKGEVDTGSVDVTTEGDSGTSPPSGAEGTTSKTGVRISATADSQGLDQGYKYVVEVILNLNHDRYKSYFNYFIVMHLGIVAAMHADLSKTMSDASRYLSTIGIALGFGWLGVLYKIQRDIEQAWSLIRDYENSSQYTQRIKVSETDWKGFRASWIMLFIPFGFLVFYVLALIT